MSIDNVADVTPRLQYVASASQTDFDYNFSIFTDADLVVIVDGVTQALNTDYTVSRAEEEDTDPETHGGTVTFADPLAGGEIVTIYRDIDISRSTDIAQNGPWDSTAYNDEQDKIFLLLQQIDERVNRSLRIPIIAEVDDADIELTVAAWAGKYLQFDSDGKPTPVDLSSVSAYRSGATNVADGGTVTHGFSSAPSSVIATPSTSGEFVSVTAVGATTFTVAIKKHDNSAGTTQTIYWRAEA